MPPRRYFNERSPARPVRTPRRFRRAAWVRLHERPRRLWPRAPFAAVIGGHDHFHGRRFRDCVHRSACVRLNRGRYSACATRSLGLSGSPFGLGLCLSGMNEPSKVLAFLDLAGDWDPSLALVMGGGIALALPAFALARRRRIDWSGQPIDCPGRREIDAPLALGALTFGVGWGLGG